VDRSCAPAEPAGPNLPDPLSLPEPERQAIAAQLVGLGFPAPAIGIAWVIGALSELRDLAAAEAAIGPDAALRWLRMRQAVTERVLLAMLDVSATLAEIDCEGERGDQLRERLQLADATRTRRLGLAGVMIGAATAALTGGLSLLGADRAGDIAGIVGGGAGATVSGAALFVGSTAEFGTPRNMLAEIAAPPARSAIFPPVVWRWLTRGGAESAAAVMASDWRTVAPERRALLLGHGGRYTVEDLDARDLMLDTLDAQIARMSQELRSLLGALLTRPEPRLHR
jgi:hypothetical protein